MLVGSKISIMAIHFRIVGFEIAKCTARTAQHNSLRLTRDSTKPTAGHDLLAANEAFLLPCIVTSQVPNLLFERFHPTCQPRPGEWLDFGFSRPVKVPIPKWKSFWKIDRN